MSDTQGIKMALQDILYTALTRVINIRFWRTRHALAFHSRSAAMCTAHSVVNSQLTTYVSLTQTSKVGDNSVDVILEHLNAHPGPIAH